MNKYNHILGKLFGFLNKKMPYAVTIGQTTYFSCNKIEVDPRWYIHENQHKLQYKRDGIFVFLLLYYIQYMTKKYEDIDYEQEAILAAKLGKNI